MWLKEGKEHIIERTPSKDQLDNLCWQKEFANTNIHSEEKTSCYPEKKQALNMTELQQNLKLENWIDTMGGERIPEPHPEKPTI